MLKALRHRPETVFALILLWKAALLVFTAQPIPANDSFFYDGAVVNYLVHGQYCNPSIANALPISGKEVFSAYPPLYQLTLLGWMNCFGTSVLAAMWLHFVLFALYAALLLATLREVRVSGWGVHFAGLFLLGITFHDRPDSLAQVFGMAAVYAAARALRHSSSRPWLSLSALTVVFCLCTSLQIGGIYFLLVSLVTLLPSRLPVWRLADRRSAELHPAVSPTCSRQDDGCDGDARFSSSLTESNSAIQQSATLRYGRGALAAKSHTPWLPLAVMTLVPLVLVLGVRFLWPHLWAGFQEHAQQTPSLTSWRKPELMEVIKILRAVPGLLIALVLLPILCWQRRVDPGETLARKQFVILLSTSAAAIAVLFGALFFLTANMVLITAYLQPLVVGVFLALWAGTRTSRLKLAAVRISLGLAVLLTSTRALGLTTVGVACARDVSRSQALAKVNRELAATPTSAAIAVSAAYLYDAWPEEGRLKLIHSDWLGPAMKGQPNAEVDALRAVKPTRLILTQFDYYRRYVRVLAQLQSTAGAVSVRVENLARVRPPDASPRWQRVVQHVSWAPVIVMLEWADEVR